MYRREVLSSTFVSVLTEMELELEVMDEKLFLGNVDRLDRQFCSGLAILLESLLNM